MDVAPTGFQSLFEKTVGQSLEVNYRRNAGDDLDPETGKANHRARYQIFTRSGAQLLRKLNDKSALGRHTVERPVVGKAAIFVDDRRRYFSFAKQQFRF